MIERFVGQRHVVAQIEVALNAVWCTRRSLPHMLLCGPPGLGKTELARIVANEVGVTLKETLGQTLRNGGRVAGFLLAAEEGDVLFVDEVHELPREAQTQLYRAMAERKVFLGGPAFGEEADCVEVPRFTLLAATTHEFRLAKPLRDRFEMLLRFKFYDEREVARIVAERVRQLAWNVAPEVPALIAARSRGTPRSALRLLKSAKRVAASRGADAVTAEHLNDAVRLEGIDEIGLDPTEQAYLRLLASRGGPVRPGTIAAVLDVPMETVRNVIEAFPIRAGLVERTPHGRVLTAKGRAHVDEHGSDPW